MSIKTVEVEVDLDMFTISELIDHIDNADPYFMEDYHKDWLLSIIRRGYAPLDSAMWREIHKRMLDAGYGETGVYDPIVDLSFQLGYMK